jgi:hypothetical protein
MTPTIATEAGDLLVLGNLFGDPKVIDALISQWGVDGWVPGLIKRLLAGV